MTRVPHDFAICCFYGDGYSKAALRGTVSVPQIHTLAWDIQHATGISPQSTLNAAEQGM